MALLVLRMAGILALENISESSDNRTYLNSSHTPYVQSDYFFNNVTDKSIIDEKQVVSDYSLQNIDQQYYFYYDEEKIEKDDDLILDKEKTFLQTEIKQNFSKNDKHEQTKQNLRNQKQLMKKWEHVNEGDNNYKNKDSEKNELKLISKNISTKLKENATIMNSIETSTMPILVSRSLVAPVLKKKKSSNKTKLNKDTNDKTYHENKVNNKHQEMETENGKNKIEFHQVHNEPSNTNSTISNATRNNPYPYGPLLLPNHPLHYNPLDSIGYYPTSRKNYENNFLISEEIFKQEQQFLVKTEKPPVLFYFDKPGYKPKISDYSVPPT